MSDDSDSSPKAPAPNDPATRKRRRGAPTLIGMPLDKADGTPGFEVRPAPAIEA
ncbi:MAG: hypothetical protein IT378_07430, partial [Sandaracinaceae bacterium]|nr:hypothetical protein [Sandaracinaceae bacterium]